MKKIWQKLMALICVSAMLLSGIAAHAEGEKAQVDGSKKASPTELACENRDTRVTLSLPSAEYQNKVDIVLVIDSSSSTDLGAVFIDSVKTLFEGIVTNNSNTDLKVGVVLYTGRANDAIEYVSGGTYKELTPYNDTTKDYFEQSFAIRDTMDKTTFQQTFGRGSSPHGGLDIADEWLTADEEVDNANKYVVLLTDGKGYIWNDENNVPTTIYAQYYQWVQGPGESNIANGGKVGLSQVMGYNKNKYSLDVIDPTNHSNVVFYDSYETLYNLTDEELTGTNDWDEICTYAIDTTTPSGNAIKHPTTNGVDLFGDNNYAYWFEWVPDAAWKGVDYLQCNPYVVVKNDNETYTFDTTQINPLYYQYHFDNLQKGLYKAGHLWTEMGEKYHCGVITYDSSGGGGLELVGPFKEWIRANSEYSAVKTDAAQVNDMFTDIDNSIRYMVDSGIVTDVIGDDFTLLNPDAENCFTLTVNGEALEGTMSEVVNQNDGRVAHVWVYGADTMENALYTAGYYVDDPQTLYWEINTPVENAKPVTFSYELRLREDAPTGFYETNKSALLEYSPTVPGGSNPEVQKRSTSGAEVYTFEVPVVSYIACTEIEVEKVWEDNDNAAGARPDKVTVILEDEDKNEWTLDLSSENEWKGSFTHDPDNSLALPDSKLSSDGKSFIPISYTLKEVEVGNYSSTVDGDAKDGFKITNTYVPPTTEEETTEAATTAPETTEEQTTPPTGDSTNMLLFAGLFLAAAAVFVLTGKTKAREEK